MKQVNEKISELNKDFHSDNLFSDINKVVSLNSNDDDQKLVADYVGRGLWEVLFVFIDATKLR